VRNWAHLRWVDLLFATCTLCIILLAWYAASRGGSENEANIVVIHKDIQILQGKVEVLTDRLDLARKEIKELTQ